MTENKSLKRFDACTIYIVLWLLGFEQVENIVLSNKFISLAFYLFYILTTLYYVVRVYVFYRPRGTMSVLCIFFAILFCYGFGLLVMNDARGQDSKSFLMMLFTSLGPIFAFYVLTIKGLLTPQRMRRWFFLFILLAINTYYVTKARALELLVDSNYDYEEVVNNTSYSFAGLLPFVFLFKKKPVLQYLLIAVLSFFVIAGLKRGAMLSGALIIIWFVFVSLRTVSKRKKWGFIILTVVALVGGYYYISQYYEESDLFQKRFEETSQGNSSNRDYLYSSLWNHFIDNDNILQVLFGEGAYHTENIASKAHNDWLELLIDCGLLTVFIYIVYWLCFFHDWRRCRMNPLIYSMLGACFIFTFSRTFYSMSFSNMPYYLDMILGFCLGNVNYRSFSLQNTSEYE